MEITREQFFDAVGHSYPDRKREGGVNIYNISGEVLVSTPVWGGRGGYIYQIFNREEFYGNRADSNPMTNGRFNW